MDVAGGLGNVQKGMSRFKYTTAEKGPSKDSFSKPEIKEGVEYRLLVSYRQKNKTRWADPGFEIAWDQMDLPWHKPVNELYTAADSPVDAEENGESLTIRGKNFTYRFDKKTGLMKSMEVNGKEC